MLRRIRLLVVLLVASIVLALWRASSAEACPGCKEAAFQSPEEGNQAQASAQAYGLSIGMMLLVPVVLIGGIAAKIAHGVAAAKSKVFDTPGRSR